MTRVQFEGLRRISFKAAFDDIYGLLPAYLETEYDKRILTIVYAAYILKAQEYLQFQLLNYEQIENCVYANEQEKLYIDEAIYEIDHLFNINEEGCFEHVLEYIKGKYSNDELIALILFADCSGDTLSIELTSSYTVKLAKRILDIREEDIILDISAGTGEFVSYLFDMDEKVKIYAAVENDEFRVICYLRSILIDKKFILLEKEELIELLQTNKVEKVFFDSCTKNPLMKYYWDKERNLNGMGILGNGTLAEKMESEIGACCSIIGNSLSDNGKAIVVVKNILLSSLEAKEDRG